MKAKKEKIRVTTSREEVRELEISFPYYTKDEGMWCKFFSRGVAIWVVDFPFTKQIEYSSCGVPEAWLINKEISEEEFNAKFKEVMTALIDINNEKTI